MSSCTYTCRDIHVHMYTCSQCLLLFTCFTLLRRQKALQDGTRKAIDVPLQLMKLADRCWPHLSVLAECGNIRAISDLQVREEQVFRYYMHKQVHTHWLSVQ